MSSNRVVTYIDLNINSVDEYWSQIIVPSVQTLRNTPSRATVFSAALSSWDLHDWVWHEQNPGQNSRGSAFDTYQRDLLAACPQLGWLRDIADAGKHRGLGRLPQVTGAEPQRIATAL